MAWIESHQELARHPKTLRLARRLGVSVPAAIGHLQLLWWWAMDFAPDGSLVGFEPGEIAQAVMWDGNPEGLIDGLMAAKFIDAAPGGSGYVIHDWSDYAGRLIEKRQANAERMRNARANNVQRTSGARAGATVPYRTVPNPTVPDTSPQPPPRAEGETPPAPRKRGERAGQKARTNGVAHDESQAAKPLQEPPLAPADDRDRRVWNLARGHLGNFGLTAGNVEAVGLLVPVGRAADGGLRLRAPPGLGLARFTHHIARALTDAGDQYANRLQIFESLPDSEGS